MDLASAGRASPKKAPTAPKPAAHPANLPTSSELLIARQELQALHKAKAELEQQLQQVQRRKTGEGLNENVLSPAEIEEAIMRCCWVAHYWTLAHQLGICSSLAAEKAAYWKELAFPEDMFFTVARMAAEATLNGSANTPVCELPDEGSSTCADGRISAGGGGSRFSSGGGSSSTGAATVPLVQDMVELERAMRQLAELRIEGQVVSCIGRLGLQAPPPPSDPDDPSGIEASTAAQAARLLALAPAERHELRFRKSWLAYMWRRAATSGVSPNVTRDRAERWAHALLHGELRLRDYIEIDLSFQELQLLSAEEHLWRQRYVKQTAPLS